jgi:hypothetical protein
MKALLILMLILSVFVGVSTNIGWFTLYGAEFNSQIYSFAYDTSERYISLVWLFLILAHLSIFSLLFLTKELYFKYMLFCFPLAFILLFTLYDMISAIFLIPFIIVWVIALFKQANRNKKQGAKTSVL